MTIEIQQSIGQTIKNIQVNQIASSLPVHYVVQLIDAVGDEIVSIRDAFDRYQIDGWVSTDTVAKILVELR